MKRKARPSHGNAQKKKNPPNIHPGLFPERLVLSDSEYALREENAVEFASLGFDLDFQGDCAVEVKGTPADMPADSVDMKCCKHFDGLPRRIQEELAKLP